MMVLVPSLAAFICVVLFVPLVSRIARRVGLVDVPGGRKHHDDQVPLVGGLVVFLSYMAVLFFSSDYIVTLWPFFLALALILSTGALDDRFQIRAWVKFGVQILVTFIVVFLGDLQLHHLGHLFGFGKFELGFMAIPFSIACVMLLLNAINLMDGLDGLAGGISLVILLWLIAACFVAGDSSALGFISPLAAALVGFLVYNLRTPFRKKASVFLGDAGSMTLGLSIAWIVMTLARKEPATLEPMSVAWILAVPIMDECAQFYRRVREGRHPFSPDRGHFHHRFVDAGFSVGQSTVIILCLSGLMGAIGYGGVLLEIPQIILTSLWIFLLLLHMVLSDKENFYVTFLSRLREMLYRRQDKQV